VCFAFTFFPLSHRKVIPDPNCVDPTRQKQSKQKPKSIRLSCFFLLQFTRNLFVFLLFSPRHKCRIISLILDGRTFWNPYCATIHSEREISERYFLLSSIHLFLFGESGSCFLFLAHAISYFAIPRVPNALAPDQADHQGERPVPVQEHLHPGPGL